MNKKANEKIERTLFAALQTKDCGRIRALCEEHPWLIKDHLWDRDDTWLKHAIDTNHESVVELLLDLGFNVNSARRGHDNTTALENAIHREVDSVVELLLSRGADPNMGRPIISAINTENPERRMKYLKLLIKAGVDLNKQFELYRDKNKLFTALDWTNDPAVVDFLKRHGAKTLAELAAEAGQTQPKSVESTGTGTEVIEHFSQKYGKVDEHSATIEMVPRLHPVSVHYIWPTKSRNHITLFTSGLSRVAMKTPPEGAEYKYAELYIQLPASFKAPRKPALTEEWPIEWLHQIANYPHDNETWLGGPLTIIANGEPPEPVTK